MVDHDSVRVVCRDGRFHVTMRIARLSAGRRVWGSFTVSVNYIVAVDGLHVRATRDPSPEDYIGVEGIRRLGNRIAIATIFSKVFSKEREFPILPESIANDKRFADLGIGQLVVDNGWIGLSVVPRAVMERVVDEAVRGRRLAR